MRITEDIKSDVLKALENWKTPGSCKRPFSWPDDALASKEYSYDLHCVWVSAWNATGREKPVDEFLKEWIEQEAKR